MTTKQLRQRKFMLQQGFSVGCQHHEEFFVTKNLLSLQMKQAESRNSVATRNLLSHTDYCNMKKLIETKEELQRRLLWRQGDVCRDAGYDK